jgi:chemotaxis protein methyltransferase CheR
MTLNDQQLKYFADFIEKELGIVYAPMNYFQLDQRIEKIAQYLGLKSAIEVYDKSIKEGIFGDFKQYMLDIATNNETSFFRDPKVFQSIEKTILPQILTATPKPSLYRIWCAASSFGQEPYSMAMLVHEFSKLNPTGPRFEIIGTDIADHALKRCNEAKYSQLEIQRGLSAARMIQNFTKTEDNYWILKPEVKNLLKFKKQNLLEPYLGMGTFNIILCRYVLIYQDQVRKKAIIEKLEKCLVPGGYLILGASESALGLTSTLEQVSLDGAIAYRKKL